MANVKNRFIHPNSGDENDLVVGGTLLTEEDSILSAEGKASLSESDYSERWRVFVANALTLNKNVVGKTDDYTLTTSNEVVIFTISSNKIATLPDPTVLSDPTLSGTEKPYLIVNKYTSTANITFSRSIDGDASFELMPGESISTISDTTEYVIFQ